MRVLTRLAEIREALKRRVRQAEGCGQGGRSRQGTSRRSAPKARGCCRLARRRARCVRGGRGCGGICSAVRRRRLLAIEQRSPTSDPRATACACVSPAGLSWPAWGAWPRPASTSCWETSSWSYTVTALLERGVRCPVHCSRPHARLTHDAACLPGPAPIRLTSPGTEPLKGAGGLT